jgi:hypothetical protein
MLTTEGAKVGDPVLALVVTIRIEDEQTVWLHG